MTLLYLTADKIGGPGGGPSVTANEASALRSLGPCEVLGREELEKVATDKPDPWCWDARAVTKLTTTLWLEPFKLAHIYAGTFTNTIRGLKENGCKVTVMAAAHDINKSRKAHLDLGLPYDYPHLTDPKLFRQYVGGYAEADVLIVPSTHSRDVMRQWCDNRIEVIPHGVNLPAGEVKPLPRSFRVGYLGSWGADKNVKTLLQAWKKLDYRDATLVLGGSHSVTPFATQLIKQYGSGNIELLGWVKDISDFYNNISLYVQPSITEGFGLEVLEAMVHSRAVLCSTGTGAIDVVPFNPHGLGQYKFTAGNVGELADKIHEFKTQSDLDGAGCVCREVGSKFTWDLIKERYCQVWRELLT